MNRSHFSLSAQALRLIACVAMLLDHIGFCYGIHPLRWVGRIAFPLFVFLLVNGLAHTHCRWRYALRLLVFALLSQAPYALMHGFSLWDSLNVLFTLLFSLLALWGADRIGRQSLWCVAPVVLFCLPFWLGLVQSDYGAKGILLAFAFWAFQGRPVLLTLAAALAMLHWQLATWLLRGTAYSLSDTAMTLASLLALPLTLAYNGQKGKTPKSPVGAKAVQLGFYAFYPAHQLLLWLLRVCT